MLGFVVRRIVTNILVILAASFFVFALVANSGDPLGDLRARPNVPKSVIEARRHELNLDKPVVVRYGIWFTHAIRGDFGRSLAGREVRPLLWQRLQVTLRMVLLASLIAVILAVVVGVVSAVRQYSALDYTATFAGFLFLSMPVFWLAALLKEYGAIRLNNFFGRQLVYTVGESDPNLTGSFLHRLGNYAGHLALPTIALALISFAAWSRYQRSSMLDVLNSDYVRLARAKGLSPFRVMTRHALRNALIPITTVVAIDFAGIIGGAVITEKVFSWQGMGQLLIDGVRDSDVNVVAAWLLVTAMVVVMFNLVADVLYAYLDPRIRLG